MIDRDLKLYLYHYNKCSKSIQVKNYLDKENITYKLIEYINSPIDIKLLNGTLKSLTNKPEEIIRINEPTYKKIGTKLKFEENLLSLITKYPILLQRPIISIEKNNEIIKSLLCRPPELIKSILF